jgi:hypothetical protein
MKATQNATSLAYDFLGKNPKARLLMKDVVQILEPLQNMKDMVSASFTYRENSPLTENGSSINGYCTHNNITPTSMAIALTIT